MTEKLRDQLQATLGDEYSLEREIEGGGMSRIFVAEDKGLGRKVVVKVLPPDLASMVSTERFRREILLAAKLQHPHIVPVHAAGETNGLPYYIMPFVDGQSLRERLAQPEPIPIPAAIRIVREVADALEHAHRRGLVHRDIKPGNILLSGDHALVTDFGVAKALQMAGAPEVDGSVTTGNVVPGTPAYMAPEHALGDATMDHRADLYALGCVAYELLAGHRVFPNRSAQAVVAAHASETPTPIDRSRAGIPPEVSALVMRCLAKRPEDRPQTAGEVRDELERVTGRVGGTSTTDGYRRRAVHLTLVGIASVVVIAIGAWVWRGRERPAPVDEDLIVVAPLHVSGDESLAFLREGMVDLLAANLTGDGGPRAVDPRATLAAWNAAGDDKRELTADEARLVARRLGAGQVLLASVVGNAPTVVITTTLIDTKDGRVINNNQRVEGRSDSLAKLTDDLTSVVLASRVASDSRRMSVLQGVPLEALRAYLEGHALFRRGRFSDAVDAFDRALGDDSTFAPAALAMTLAASWGGRLPDQVRAARLAWASRDKLSRRDRALARVYASWQLTSDEADLARGNDVALALWDTAARLAPDNPEVLHGQADFLFHYAPALMERSEAHRLSAQVFSRVLSIDSSYAAAYEHLVDLASEAGDTARARWAAAKYFALDSTSDHVDYVRWRVAHALGDSLAIRAARDRMRSASFVSLQRIAGIAVLDGIGAADVAAASAAMSEQARSPQEVRSAGFVRAADMFNRGRSAAGWQIGKLAPFPDSAFVLMSLFWDADPAPMRAAAPAFDRLLARDAPDSPEARADRYRLACSLAEWYLAAGDTTAARRVATHLRPNLPDAVRERIDGANSTNEGLCVAMVDAWLAVQGRAVNARALTAHYDSLVQRTVIWDGLFEMPLVVARLWEALGEPSRARSALRRRPYHWATGHYLATTYYRTEGRLAESVNDREGAIQAYRAFLALRTEPEPRLSSEVAAVRQRLAALERESAGR